MDQWEFTEKSSKSQKWDHKGRTHGEVSGNSPSEEEIASAQCSLDGPPAKHLVTGLYPATGEDRVDEEGRGKLEPTRYLSLSIP